MEKESILKYEDFPSELKEFIAQNGIQPDAYDVKQLNRFFSNPVSIDDLNAQFLSLPQNASTAIEEDEVNLDDALSRTNSNDNAACCTPAILPSLASLSRQPVAPQAVPWLPGFYCVPAETPIASLDAYKRGQLFCIDASSALVVKALDPQLTDHVLDLCCAPGAKTCMIADEMRGAAKASARNSIDRAIGDGASELYSPSTATSSSTAVKGGEDASEKAKGGVDGAMGSVTGVDISEKRLGVCRTMVRKYNIPNVRLFLHDARTFGVLSPEDVPLGLEKSEQESVRVGEAVSIGGIILPMEEEPKLNSVGEMDTEIVETMDEVHEQKIGARSVESGAILSFERDVKTLNRNRDEREQQQMSPEEMEKLLRKRKHEQAIKKKQKRHAKKKKCQQDQPNLFFCSNWKFRAASHCLYDKILLDAHCTLDASIRHILKYNKVGWKEFTPTLALETSQLQKELLSNAFNLLKPGGVLVYSTCSFSKLQNEDVIQWLLDKEKSACLVPIIFQNCQPPTSEGFIPFTLRLYPKHSGTSGMFIAKLQKRIGDDFEIS